tara:strand:+ start:406 stop:648 length:243 start_codon:yes stop_codon:yes gene_type:complete
MAEQKKNVKDYLDALVDKEGLRTDVTVTLTNETLCKIVGGLMAAGVGIALIAHLLKNAFPNKQLTENNRLLLEIKKGLKG